MFCIKGTIYWEQRKLGEIFKYEQPQPYIVKCTEYDDINEIPVLTAGQSFILGYTDEEFGIKDVSDENPLIIFDDFTTSSHYVDFPFKVKSSAIKLLTLNTKKDNINCAFNVLQGITYVPISHERHWISIFSSFDVLLPKSNDEQELVGGFFKSLNHLITLHQSKYFRHILKAITSCTLYWEQRKLGEFGKATGGISIESEFDEHGKYKVISIGSYSEESKYTDQGIRVYKTKKTESRILNKNDLVMILNDKTSSGNIIGRVLLVDKDNTYVYNQRTERIEINKSKFLPEYLYQLLNSDNIREKIICASQGNTQIYVNWTVIREFTYKITTDIEEQGKIARFFISLNHLITLHQRKLEKLKIIKKSMLENLFPQNGEKTPKIRFSGFTKDWEQRKWIDVVDISKDMVDPQNGKYDNLPHISPGNIESFTGQLYDNVKCVKDENLISGKFKFSSGDIIYGKINPQLGKYLYATFSGLTSADAYVINAKNDVIQKYLYTIIQTRNFFEYSVSVSMRSGMPKINRDELNAYSFFAPVTDEQLKIGNCILKYDHLITLHQLEPFQLIFKAIAYRIIDYVKSKPPSSRK